MIEIRLPLAAGHVFTEDTLLSSSVRGSATVKSGRFELWGLIDGDLTIEPGVVAVLHGTIHGALINNGGDVEFDGVAGEVRDAPGVKTKMLHGATIASHLKEWRPPWQDSFKKL